MKRFRVLVGGEHIKMDVSGDRCYMGFFVTCFVKAATSDLARSSAIAAVRTDTRLDGLILNTEDDDPPLIFVDEVEEVSERDVPEVEPGFVLFKDEDRSANSEISPPYLVICRGVSFWVENRPLSDWTATPQAFHEGCFRNACLYDTNGDLWRIVQAKFKQQPSFVNALLPWRQLPVLVEISSSPKPAVAEILAELALILEAGNSFSDNLDSNPGDILECLKCATTPSELIQCAGKCV